MESKQLVEISEQHIKKHSQNVYGTLVEFQHRYQPQQTDQSSRLRRNTLPGTSATGFVEQTQTIKLIDRISNITPDHPLLTDQQHHLMTVLHRGLAIATALIDEFSKLTGLKQLQEDNARGTLENSLQQKFKSLLQTSAFISLHAFAEFIEFKYAQAPKRVSYPELILDIQLSSPLASVKHCLAQYYQLIDQYVKTDDDLIGYSVFFADTLLDELARFKGSLANVDNFQAYNFHVVADDFNVNGLERQQQRQKSQALTMTFKKPEEVVGNAIAKYQAQKLAKMLVCYDFKQQQNPFAELGGFIFTFMGDGKPGTGKTTLIQMLAGLLHQYCEVAGYPFYYENFGPDNIDSYQGKSGQNAKQFIRNIINPQVIGFGTIDDIDQVAGKRGDKQSSAGQQEVTAVLMESFAGSGTRVLGNCSFGLFSNYPENVDDALRQRASARFLIDGPQTQADYIDILALLLGNNHDIPTGDVELFASQQIQQLIQSNYEQHNLPQEEKLLDVYQQTVNQLGPLDSLEKLGHYLKNIQQADERFTGRAIKNITDAVKVRSMDFDMPDEWFAEPQLFLHKPYDEKLQMIKSLQQPITSAMVLQEVNRYADSEFRYAASSDDAYIADRVRQLTLEQQVQQQFANQQLATNK
ncbi:ATP-binding protein [Spartinivicinus ruber]|uniref:ATP-binding protein n=1 Tax=Spartinivicinus ruber TaxID=2683272 RepID=UPI0013D8DC65|nr:ATP-binding protein [Spartinivicinus ruber]